MQDELISNCSICKKQLFRPVISLRSSFCKDCKKLYFHCCKCQTIKTRDKLSENSNSICIDCKNQALTTFICKDCGYEFKIKQKNKDHKRSRCYDCIKKRQDIIDNKNIPGELLVCSECKKSFECMTVNHIKSCFNMTMTEFVNKYGKDKVYSKYYRNKMKILSNEACTDEVKEAISQNNKDWWAIDDNKQKMSESLKIAQNTEEAKNNHRDGFYNYLADETKEHQQQRVNTAKKSWLDPEIRQKRIDSINTEESLLARSIGGKKGAFITLRNCPKITSIAIKLSDALKEKLVFSILEYEFDYYYIDIAIPELKIAIECDGDFWHGNTMLYSTLRQQQKDRQSRDKAKTTYLTNRGWTVLRFWGSQINKDVDSCVNEVLTVINKKGALTNA